MFNILAQTGWECDFMKKFNRIRAGIALWRRSDLDWNFIIPIEIDSSSGSDGFFSWFISVGVNFFRPFGIGESVIMTII